MCSSITQVYQSNRIEDKIPVSPPHSTIFLQTFKCTCRMNRSYRKFVYWQKCKELSSITTALFLLFGFRRDKYVWGGGRLFCFLRPINVAWKHFPQIEWGTFPWWYLGVHLPFFVGLIIWNASPLDAFDRAVGTQVGEFHLSVSARMYNV